VASFYVYINFSADRRTWTCAYRTVSSYLKCPSITSGPSIDAATISLRRDVVAAHEETPNFFRRRKLITR
jgi:hypothetical protein